MTAHFFDLSVLIEGESQVWIVSKTKPSVPLIKLSTDEFNLIRKGIYIKYNQKVRIGNTDYWFSQKLSDDLKIKCVKTNTNITDLSFSMQEFMNKELIENLEYTINIENILHLKNTDDDIYVICSKNNRKNYELMISKIEDKLKENGLTIKKFYYISETFYNRNSDDISHKKVRLLLQHLIGLKTEGDKFTDEKLEQYSEVSYYDDEETSTQLACDSNKLLMVLLERTESSLKDIIKSNLKSTPHTLFVNYITGNKANRFVTTKVDIQFSNLITVFERFNWK